MKRKRTKRFFPVLLVCLIAFVFGTVTSYMSQTEPEDTDVLSTGVMLTAAPDDIASDAANESCFEVNYEDDTVSYDLTDEDSALQYIDNYAANLESDATDFEKHTAAAIEKIRESVFCYASALSLLPPVIAIVLALITKEVYSSLIIGILVGGVLYASGNFEGTIIHVISDGFVGSLTDSYNMGILIFLVLLGALVAMMNKAGGSAAFGKWALKHIKTRKGAQLATVILGILIFIDDYFNCLTVGSVMRPVTDEHKISRAKLSYLIDATAAPVCIIAPISSWAAAVAGFAKGAGAENGLSLFIQAIPYNFYAILTICMMLFLAITDFDFGLMKKHEDNARLHNDLFTTQTKAAVEEMTVNEKGRVIDLIVPVAILIVCCVVGMIYSGGFFTGEDFITAFSNSDASVGLAYGAAVAIVIDIVYFLLRRVMKFTQVMECIPEGFKSMVSAILILSCAWTLKSMTDSLGAKIFISQLVEQSANGLEHFLPFIIFLIAVGLSFATGTSWGTFGILIPIVLSVFRAGNPLLIVSISACMAGAVCGDHCSPISDTTIMASAGAQCEHLNHVKTQLPYALTVAGVSAVSYLISGFLTGTYLVLPIAIVLMIATLFVIKIATGKAKAK